MGIMWNTTETITYDLPDWMRQARRGVDWGVLLVIALSLLAAWPFIRYSNLPHTNASENYVYRTADYADAFQEGHLYPRWSANALGGYGAPIPNYYPPAAPYLAASLEILFTADPVSAVRLLYIASLCIAGASVYVFVTRRSSAVAGVLAAVLYVYSPYVGMVAPFVMGDLPGVLALALISSLLWAVDRFLMVNRPLDVLFISMLMALLCLTSLRAAAVGVLLVAALTLWHRRFYERKMPIRVVMSCLLLGVGLASFYWVPLLLEQSAVHWRASTVPVEPLRLTLNTLFTPLRSLDPNEMVVSPQLTIGLISLIFAIAGGAAFFRFRGKVGFQGLFLVIGVGLLLLTLVFFPAEVWLLGPIMLCLSIGGSAIVPFRDYLVRRRRRLFLPVLIVLIWIGSTAVWFVPQYEEVFGSTSPVSQLQYEQQGYGIAVLPAGAAVPVTIPDNLPYNRSLLDSFQSDTINKIAPGQISAAFQASPLLHFSETDHFLLRRVTTPKQLEILTAYFPGWYATLSDRVINLTRSANGLILVDIPVLDSSTNELIVTLGTTNVRTGAWLLSGAFLAYVLLTSLRRMRRRRSGFEELILLSRSESRLMVAPVVSFVVITLVFSYVDLPLSLFARSGYNLSNGVQVNARTDTGLSLLAFQLSTNQYTAGDRFHITLYWQAQRTLSENYQVKLSLVNNRDGSQWKGQGYHIPGYYPTRRWNTRQYVTDRYEFTLPEEMPDGNYQIRIEASQCDVDCKIIKSLTFFDTTGQNQGVTFTLPTLVTVMR